MIRVKVCGLTAAEDALVAAEAGADMLGLVFHPPSSRFVSADQAAQIVAAVKQNSPRRLQWVGVFVDAELSTILETAARCGLDTVQLHGNEPPQLAIALANHGLAVWKAFRAAGQETLAQIVGYPATAYLLDACVPGRHGGTGQTFDWALARQAALYGPLVLAGGLTPANVAQAIAAAQPWAVDVSTGVEAAPGRKDREKVRSFIAQVCRSQHPGWV